MPHSLMLSLIHVTYMLESNVVNIDTRDRFIGFYCKTSKIASLH